MELAFATQTLRRICEDPVVARRRFGEELARELEDRLADLRAAESLAGLPVGAPMALQPAWPIAQIPLGISGHLEIEANHKMLDWPKDGQLEPGSVWRVKITAIQPGAEHD